ncbi:putative phospholipase A2 (PlaA) [Aspergillus mulundensis]|uniref:Lysophospholipase n=1 Tax=Aspergillus mulundensis TaxID=1810919 RepID=A0A3D8SVT7_9EURO|nr:Lysophospholipase [Aspergillus mulundensis]RDW90437.1 Lysophospholipase [Aspergillus mulundensis]
MGAARAFCLRFAPPAALIYVGGRVLWSIEAARNKSQLFLLPEPTSPYSTTSTQSIRGQSRHPTGNDKADRNDSNHVEGHFHSSSEDSSSIWSHMMQRFEGVKQSVGSPEWIELEHIKHYITPDWTRLLPDTVQKLQRELSMAPGSLADQIWREAQDPDLNPEILRKATVRVSDSLCNDELEFRQKRQKHAVKALSAYLNIPEEDIHPDDVPIISMCGSGGGLRALVAGTGSYLATQEAGLWDCVTYTAGVSGSCWLQVLYHSSITGCNFTKLVAHLKNRLGVHMAFPPAALKLLTHAPTNKYLLSGLVQKLKGDPGADFGLVDIYGMLLAARLLVPKGELGSSDFDLKLSNQNRNIADGAHPLPIYTAVRHEIPVLEEKAEKNEKPMPEDLIRESQSESWFQWFEFTPYEFFCEELNAGIPTWALGRHFRDGKNDVPAGTTPMPELHVGSLMGVWGSAFCATLSHYYKEIRPLVKGITGFGGIDSLIQGKSKDLIRVHPIDPATIPNYVLGMKDQLPPSCPESIFQSQHLRLMDAGMSNNLPIYPLLRPGRDVDIIIAFDNSADIKQENWLSVVDGYARQRGIKGWPVGAGWPRAADTLRETEQSLREPENMSEEALNKKITAAQDSSNSSPTTTNQAPDSQPPPTDTDLDYCNVWVGTKQERLSEQEPPPSKRLFDPRQSHTDPNHSESDFHLMRPDAGIAVVYFPLLPNPSAPDLPPSTSLTQPSPSDKPSGSQNTSKSHDTVDPEQPFSPHPATINPDVDDFLSTWNFVYTPEQIDAVVGLAKANFAQGEQQVKRVVRAVYERKKKDRLEREERKLEPHKEGLRLS